MGSQLIGSIGDKVIKLLPSVCLLLSEPILGNPAETEGRHPEPISTPTTLTFLDLTRYRRPGAPDLWISLRACSSRRRLVDLSLVKVPHAHPTFGLAPATVKQPPT